VLRPRIILLLVLSSQHAVAIVACVQVPTIVRTPPCTPPSVNVDVSDTIEYLAKEAAAAVKTPGGAGAKALSPTKFPSPVNTTARGRAASPTLLLTAQSIPRGTYLQPLQHTRVVHTQPHPLPGDGAGAVAVSSVPMAATVTVGSMVPASDAVRCVVSTRRAAVRPHQTNILRNLGFQLDSD
jgi:hypothetical protein